MDVGQRQVPEGDPQRPVLIAEAADGSVGHPRIRALVVAEDEQRCGPRVATAPVVALRVERWGEVGHGLAVGCHAHAAGFSRTIATP